MQIAQLLFLTSLVIFSNVFSMDLTTEINYFNSIPTDLLPIILIRNDHHQYPWQNFIHASQLKHVCKAWYEVVANTDTLAQILSIPPMHCAAMMNNPNKIIELKLSGHSPLAPDSQKLIPMDYALACGQTDALTMLRIGLATAPDRIKFIRQYDEKTLKILQKTSINEYTKKDLITAI